MTTATDLPPSPLVTVARAEHLSEAEFLQGLLLAEGVPSLLRRARGFDVPDFLAAGPRDVLVEAANEHAARDVLLQASDEAPAPASAAGVSPRGLLAGMLIVLAGGALFVLLFTEILATLHPVLRG